MSAAGRRSRRPGALALVLHTHLPYIRHPEQEDFLEERWLFEAITESYLPLLERFQRLVEDRVRLRLTMSFTPTLLAMLADPMLGSRYLRHLERLIELSDREILRTRWMPQFQRLAWYYHHRLTRARQLYVDTYRQDLIGAFRVLGDAGVVEPIASCATHGYLPLMRESESVRAQVQVGLRAHEEAFGRRSSGFWLPECGYDPAHDRCLRDAGIRYCIVDAHGVMFGSPRPKYGIYAPVSTPRGLAVFGRDRESSKSVWSAVEGYPNHPDYREFYRDIGHELDYDYIRPYLNGDGTRVDTGIKYYRVTGHEARDKQPYDPDRALDRAAQHATEFLARRRAQIRTLQGLIECRPLLVSPFDTELFGHWWFEGPDWLDYVIRKAHQDRAACELVTLSEALGRSSPRQVVEPVMSSWGLQGYSDVWLNGTNDWVYRHLQMMAERMRALATAHDSPDAFTRRALNQLARELLLAQASDWLFILKAQTHTAYAHRRLQEHVGRFQRLYDGVREGRLEEATLRDIEEKDRVFPFLDYRLYATEPAG